MKWLDATRLYLARFPLSIIQLAGRINAGEHGAPVLAILTE